MGHRTGTSRGYGRVEWSSRIGSRLSFIDQVVHVWDWDLWECDQNNHVCDELRYRLFFVKFTLLLFSEKKSFILVKNKKEINMAPFEAARPAKSDIMISYHPSDSHLVDRMILHLTKNHFSVWNTEVGQEDADNARKRGKAVIDSKVWDLVDTSLVWGRS